MDITQTVTNAQIATALTMIAFVLLLFYLKKDSSKKVKAKK